MHSYRPETSSTQPLTRSKNFAAPVLGDPTLARLGNTLPVGGMSDAGMKTKSALVGKPLLYFTSCFVSLGVFLFGTSRACRYVVVC